jgi:hypothetical protein
LKQFECNAESKATEQPKPQRRKQSKNKDEPKREDQNQKKARNSTSEGVRCSAAENRSEKGKSSGIRMAEKPLRRNSSILPVV